MPLSDGLFVNNAAGTLVAARGPICVWMFYEPFAKEGEDKLSLQEFGVCMAVQSALIGFGDGLTGSLLCLQRKGQSMASKRAAGFPAASDL